VGIGRGVAFLAGDVAGDEQVRVDACKKRGGVRLAHVTAPDERVNRAAELEIFGQRLVALQSGGVEGRQVARRRQAVAEPDAVGGNDGEVGDGEQLVVGLQDLRGGAGIGVLDTAHEKVVLIFEALGDAVPAPLRQLVIAEQEMYALGELAFQRGDDVE
jgi:hypothetical protein